MPDEEKEKYQIAISEYAMHTKCFDAFTGRVSTFDADTFFTFPIDAILEFGIALHLRFPDLTTNHVIKWPDKIETVT
jgi:hypothetical protein